MFNSLYFHIITPEIIDIKSRISINFYQTHAPRSPVNLVKLLNTKFKNTPQSLFWLNALTFGEIHKPFVYFQ